MNAAGDLITRLSDYLSNGLISVTKFGKLSPLGHDVKKLWPF